MTTPDAQTVHPGHGVQTGEQRLRINAWLEANGIDPNKVVANRPIYVLALPNGVINGGLPWLIDLIVFHEFYVRPDGAKERNFITGDAVMFQRTVPLQVPFPTDTGPALEAAPAEDEDDE
ncbi:hypothetical protein [Streptomyces sp. FxanaA7]|uniref:hypothetical protein n=1 Tax=Streptomyces sp. FxanaA7 TaxID=1265492 RepID=UPI0005EF4BB4|nr:hypothetical protein [Streptomyces sp. FxanaA7]